MNTNYAKRLVLLRNPAVQRELARLDPVRDNQRMVHLLTAYEFPFDITRSLELALFHTYASPRISGLLARTGEFERHGQKRYDDTSRLISEFLESGYDSEKGMRAITHMNHIHNYYKIDNADYLFVLATFVFYPIDWIRRYGWRQLTTAEEQAFFYFFREVGRRMNLHDLPDTMADFREATAAYEKRHFRFTESNRKIADATVRIVQGWFPRFLHPVVQPAFSALISDQLRTAFGYPKPPGWFLGLTSAALWLRKWPLRWITFKPYPALIENTSFRNYPDGPPAIEAVGPENIVRELRKN
ncbi:oxygenase MpaB family protein [Spirosoma pulveris]